MILKSCAYLNDYLYLTYVNEFFFTNKLSFILQTQIVFLFSDFTAPKSRSPGYYNIYYKSLLNQIPL